MSTKYVETGFLKSNYPDCQQKTLGALFTFTTREVFMTRFRFLPISAAMLVANTLVDCNTAPGIPMGSATAQGVVMPDQNAKMDMSKMDAQMKKMREMH